MKITAKLKIVLFLLLAFAGTLANASDDSVKVELNAGADIVNRYVWRGLMLGNSASVQPSIGLSKGGFSFGSWASYSFSPAAFQEVDLYLSYTAGSFTFGLNDYYNPVDSTGTGDYYFDMKKSTTLHSLEPFITLSGIGGSPFSATAAVFVYGNDRDENGKNLYSSYFELSYSATVGDFGLDIFAGGTFNKGYYADKPAVVNTGVTISREIKVSDSFSIPLKGSFIVNPNTQNVFLVFCVTL